MNYETMTRDELLELKRQLEREIKQQDAKQHAFKILLNSAYGAVGNQHFRHYCTHEATAITISGQAALKWVMRYLNRYMNELLKTKDVDYIIYGDTDSIYVNFGPLVEKYVGDKSPEKQRDFMLKAADQKIQQIITRAYAEYSDRTNVAYNSLEMKREALGQGIFIQKKRYLMSVYNNEGVAYAEPEMKIMGLEAVRTTTPPLCREKLKQAFVRVFSHTEDEMVEFINDVHDEFMNAPVQEISMPTGVKGLDKYKDLPKGTPFHVRASILFNRKLDELGLSHDYQKIQEGEKVKVVRLMIPNPMMADAIAFNGNIPPEFGLDKYIDRESQFEKTFLKPISRVLDTIGWRTSRTVSLEDFFS